MSGGMFDKVLMMLHQGGTAEKVEQKQERRRRKREDAHGGSFGHLLRVLYFPLLRLTRGESQGERMTAGALNQSLHNLNTTSEGKSHVTLIDAHHHTIVQYVVPKI